MPIPLVAVLLFAQASASGDARQLEELTQRVDAAVREHRSRDAVGMLNQALKASPQWRHGWWLLGSILYDMDDYAAARPVLERLIQLDPKSGAPWMLLGLCEFEMKDYGLALDHLQRGDAFGVPPELDLLDVVRYHEALLLMLAERFDPAQALLDQLTRKGPDTDEIVLTQGLAALRIPAFPASLHWTTSDDRIEIIRRVGRAQHAVSKEKPEEASEIYRELIKNDPGIANLHLSFAAVLVQNRELPAAQAELLAELKLNPQSVEARLRLCALLQDDSPQEALKLAEQAVALDPKSFKTHFTLGKLFYKLEKLPESAKELETGRDLNQSSSAVRFALIRTYESLGKHAEAEREGVAFRRLRAAEDEFRRSGRVSASYFEGDAAGEPASAPKTSKAPVSR
jgi:predicted Zn-dependent protease